MFSKFNGQHRALMLLVWINSTLWINSEKLDTKTLIILCVMFAKNQLIVNKRVNNIWGKQIIRKHFEIIFLTKISLKKKMHMVNNTLYVKNFFIYTIKYRNYWLRSPKRGWQFILQSRFSSNSFLDCYELSPGLHLIYPEIWTSLQYCRFLVVKMRNCLFSENPQLLVISFQNNTD